MKVLIDIGHPAHVHLFKHFAAEMLEQRHEVYFTCRDKEYEIYFLNLYGFQFKSFGKKYKSSIGKIIGLAEFGLKELLVSLKFKPDLFLSHGSIYAAQTAWIIGKPHISFEDTFNPEQVKLYLPFTKAVLTGSYNNPIPPTKKIEYPGYHELAYLHPNRFRPNLGIREKLGISCDQKYSVIRFVSWNASHDRGHTGISIDNKIAAVKAFEAYGSVFISSEGELPEELQKYQFPLEPVDLHDALAGASLVFGESATIASEASILGVPSIYIDSTSRLYTQDLEEKYGLCFNYSESIEDQTKAIKKGIEILREDSSRFQWNKKQQALLKGNIDVSSFLIWLIKNYPESLNQIKNDSSIFDNFKY